MIANKVGEMSILDILAKCPLAKYPGFGVPYTYSAQGLQAPRFKNLIGLKGLKGRCAEI